MKVIVEFIDTGRTYVFECAAVNIEKNKLHFIPLKSYGVVATAKIKNRKTLREVKKYIIESSEGFHLKMIKDDNGDDVITSIKGLSEEMDEKLISSNGRGFVLSSFFRKVLGSLPLLKRIYIEQGSKID